MAYVTRDDMIDVFRDTEEFYSTDENLKRAISDSIKGTVFYSSENYPPLPERNLKRRLFQWLDGGRWIRRWQCNGVIWN